MLTKPQVRAQTTYGVLIARGTSLEQQTIEPIAHMISVFAEPECRTLRGKKVASDPSAPVLGSRAQ